MTAQLDPHLHHPARLRLLAMLTAVSGREFAPLRDALEVSDSVLSKHLTALGEVGYVRSRKSVANGRRTTWVSATQQGRRALKRHAAALRDILASVE